MGTLRRFRLCSGRVGSGNWSRASPGGRAGFSRAPGHEEEEEERWRPLEPARKAKGCKRSYFEELERAAPFARYSGESVSEAETEEERSSEEDSSEGAFNCARADPYQVEGGCESPGRRAEEKEEEEKEVERWDDHQLQRVLRDFELCRKRGRGVRCRPRSSAEEKVSRPPRFSAEPSGRARPGAAGSGSPHQPGRSERGDDEGRQGDVLLQPVGEGKLPWPLARAQGDASLGSQHRSDEIGRHRQSSRCNVGPVHGPPSIIGGWNMDHSSAPRALPDGGGLGSGSSGDPCYTPPREAGSQGSGLPKRLLEQLRTSRWQRRPRKRRLGLCRFPRGAERRWKGKRKRKEGQRKVGSKQRPTKEGLGRRQGEARRETKELSEGRLALAVPPPPQLSEILAECSSLERTGCALAWFLLHVSWQSADARNSLNFLMMNHSGGWLRAKQRRVALPIRVGDLAGVEYSLKQVSLLEAGEEFCRAHAQACWSYLACYACNFLCGQLGPLAAGQWTAAERQVAGAVGLMTKRFAGHGQGSAVDVPAIEKDLKLARVDYSGEEVGTCHKLSLRQIVPALPPPPQHGGSIDLMGFLSVTTQKFLRNPQLCILPDTGQPLPKLQGRIHVEKGELDGVADALVRCGVCDWTPKSEVLHYRGEAVLNGLFGVPKSSVISSGEPVLRVIMNLVASNSVMLQLQGATGNLPSITSWLSTVLDGSEQIKIWQSDMSNAFYLFRLPPQWKSFLSFNVVRSGKALGMMDDIDYVLSCCVLPMGWLSSVAIMQEISENLLLLHSLPREAQIARQSSLPLWMVGLLKESKKSERAWWHVYLDNYAGGQIVGPSEESLEGNRLHELAERAWKEAHVISSEKKRKHGVLEAEELGAMINGSDQTMGASPARMLRLVHATLWVLGSTHLSKKKVQVLAGRWVHLLQFRRAGMSFLEATWEYTGTTKFNKELVIKVRRELWCCLCALPLLHTNLGAAISNVATASDASSTGGAVGIARNLSACGKEFVEASLRSQHFSSVIPVFGSLPLQWYRGSFPLL